MEKLTSVEETLVTENRKITIIPRHGLQQGSVVVEPVYDEGLGTYRGIPHNWEELRKQGLVTSTPNDSFKFNFPSGQQYVFDLSVPLVAQRWKWIQEHPVIGKDKEAAISNTNILAYVEDVEADMIKTASVKKEKFNLESWVRSLPSTEQVKVCKLLGQNVHYLKPIDIEDYLIELARGPKYTELKKVKEDKTTHSKLFLIELRDKKIIHSFHGGYKFSDIVLGMDLPTCIYWLSQPENREIVLQWKRQINQGFEGESFSFEKELVEEPKRQGRPPLNKEVNA